MQVIRQRFRFLRKLLDLTIDLVKFLCAPAALFLAVLAVLKYNKTFENLPSWVVGLAFFAAFMVAAVLFYATKWNEISTVFFKLKRYLYTAFAPKLVGRLYKHNILSRLVINKALLSHYRVNLAGQDKTISEIVAALQNASHSKRFFIEGVSGSGKTSLFFFIVDKLLRNKNTAHLAKNILYFDFSLSEQVQLDFIEACQDGAIDDSIVFIDNFHRTKPTHLSQITNLTIEGVQASSDFGLIILSQPHDYIVTSPASDMRIIQSIREDNGHFLLTRHYDGLIHSQEMGAFVDQARRVYGIGRTSETYPLMSLHFSRVFAMTSAKSEGTLHSLVAVGEKVKSNQHLSQDEQLLVQAIGVMSGLSIHMGLFRKEDYEQTFKKLLTVNIWPLSPTRRRVLKVLKSLSRAGVVIEAVLEKRVFLFHELLAKKYREHFHGTPLFDQAFLEATETVLSHKWVRRDALIRWLYAVEKNDATFMKSGFHSALCSGAFKLMLENLKRTSNLLPTSTSEHSYQWGILAEKTGDFTEAREQLRAADGSEKLSDHQEAKVSLALIEASHDANSMTILKDVLDKNIRNDINLTARYWIAHLKSHLGHFDLDALELLADDVNKNWSDLMRWNEYDSIHLARRVYFDWLRFYYLRGQGDVETYDTIISHPLLDRLKESHVQHNAFIHKFAYAHFLHYEMLFSLGVLDTAVAPPENLPDMPSEWRSIDELLAKAEDYYEKAVNEFKVFGDKCVDYIRPRMVELKMYRPDFDSQQILAELNEYHRFLEEAGFDDMMGYGHTYSFKLHFLNAHKALLEGTTHSRSPLDEFDEYMKQAYHHLDEAERWYDQTSNGYGKATILLFRGITSMLEAHPKEDATHFDNLKGICSELSISRHVRTVESIHAQAGISPGKLVNAVRYFPVVHQ